MARAHPALALPSPLYHWTEKAMAKLVDENAYSPLDGDRLIKTDRFVRGYTAPFDAIFNRGYAGLLYGVWILFWGITALVILLDVWKVEYTIVFSLAVVDFGILFLCCGGLALASRWVDRDIKRLRNLGNIGVDDLELVIRSRGNITSDWNFLSKALMFSMFEFVFAICYGYGTINQSFLGGVLTVDSTLTDVYLFNLLKALELLIVVKAAVALGAGIDRSQAVITRLAVAFVHRKADREGADAQAAVDDPVRFAGNKKALEMVFIGADAGLASA
jgi:hypothetical protein